MAFWLMKSEPGEVSFGDVWAMPARTVSWFGVRNYQARNMMRDAMAVGDGMLFYHSNCAQPGIAGIGRIASGAYPDGLQFDPQSEYFDAKSTQASPRWLAVDVEVTQPVELISLAELRSHPQLSGMRVLARGNRLSITPVSEDEWLFITGTLARPRRIQ